MHTLTPPAVLPLALVGLLIAAAPVLAGPPQNSATGLAAVSAEVTLAGAEVLDGISELSGVAMTNSTAGTTDWIDLSGLFNAEVHEAESLFNGLTGLPVTLFDDGEAAITHLFDGNLGLAFSEMIAIPQDIVNYVFGLPGLVGNDVFDMALVIPGEYLLNFG